jgi:hypothetical protein
MRRLTLFTGIVSFIRPLYVVSLEEQNPRNVRAYAIEQLRHIDASMGIRQAGLLADTVSKQLNKFPRDLFSVPRHLMMPLMPFG